MKGVRIAPVIIGMFLVGAVTAAVFAVRQSGAASPYAASSVFGQPAFDTNTDDNALGLESPRDAIVDTVRNRLFIVDTDNHRVVVHDLSISDREADAVLGSTALDAAADPTPATDANMSEPIGIALDEIGGRLFVSDVNYNRILVFDVDVVTSGESAVRVLGQPDFTSTASDVSSASFSGPNGLAYDPTTSRLFVADGDDAHNNGVNSRVLVFDVATIDNGEGAVNVIGQPNFTTNAEGDTATGLSNATGVAIDTAGQRLFVADYYNCRVQMFSLSGLADGMPASSSLGSDDPGLPGACGSGFSDMDGASRLTYDADDSRLFVADYSRIMVFDVTDGFANHLAADVIIGQEDENAAATGAGADQVGDQIGGVFYDIDADSLYLADSNNHRLLVYDGTTLPQFSADATDEYGRGTASGSPVFKTSFGDNIPNGEVATFGGGSDIIFDIPGGRAFVANPHNRILVFELNGDGEIVPGAAVNVLGQPDVYSGDNDTTASTLNSGGGLAYDADGQRLFVADYGNNRVLVFDVSTVTDGEAAVHVLGQALMTTGSDCASTPPDFGPTATCMSRPTSLVFDEASQRLFVSDSRISRVLVFDVADITDGEPAVNVLGQPNFTTGALGTSSTTMRIGDGFGYAGLAYDENTERLFVADTSNSRVLIFDADAITDGEAAVHVLGQATFDTSTVATTATGMDAPTGVTLNGSGLLYVVDRDNNRATVYDLTSLSDGDPALAVLGQPSFTSGTGALSQTQLLNPIKLTLEPASNRLYVANGGGDRYFGYEFVNITTTTISDAVVGQPYNQPITTENDQGTLSFELVSGTLPAGLTVDSISGTPTQNGSFTFTVRALDDNGTAGSFADDQTYTLTVIDDGSGGGSGGGTTGTFPSSTPVASITAAPQPTTPGVPTVGPSNTPVASGAPSPTAITQASPTTSTPPATPGGPRIIPTGLPSAINRVFSGRTLASILTMVARLIEVLSIGAILMSTLLLSRGLTDIGAMGAFGAQSFLQVLGLKKKTHIWGTVYDSATKHPIQFAKVELFDASGRVLETRFADRDGRYGFLTSPKQLHQQTLTVLLKATASGYVFPSGRVTAGTTDFLVYEHVYTGKPVTVAADSFLRFDLPMDRQIGRPTRFSEFLPLKTAGGFMSRLMNGMFWVGLVLVPWVYWRQPTTTNLIILIAFLGVHGVRMLTGMYRPFGVVRDRVTGKPVPYALITLNDVGGARLTYSVSDEQGRYFLASKGGTYRIEAVTPANVAPQRSSSTTIVTRSGWINKRLRL